MVALFGLHNEPYLTLYFDSNNPFCRALSCHDSVYPCEIQVIIIVCRQPMDLNSTPFVCDSILRDSLSKVLRPSSSGKG